MNSRNSVNENNFVKYTPGLSLNQFEEKERIEIPFDHLYTCYSRTLSEVQRSNLQLAKEVEITTQRSPADLKMAGFSEVVALRDRITDCEREIKILKSLLIHHIDLAQLQGNDVKKKEKHYQEVKQENDTLRARLCELEKKLINQRRSQNPASSATSNSSQQGHHQSTGSQLLLNNNNYTELLIPSSRTNPFLFENDVNNTFRSNNDIKQESESLNRASPDLVVTSILDSSIPFFDFILDNPQTLEMDKTENHNDALYSVATTKSNSVISKMPKNNRKTIGTASSIGHSKMETVTSNQYAPAKSVERKYTINKKPKMMDTCSKSTNNITIKPSQYTGSLTERLQFIDNTPIGEDPYQMREADLREQSPIPKDDYNAFDVKSTLDKTKRKCGRSSNSISNNDEVPRWRETVYSPLTLPANYSSEDDSEIEAIYDAAFEKRHENLNTMELRKLKYHLWHIRELKLVEKLRQRQRDPCGPGPSTSTAPQPSEFTILPQPHKDDQLIEIERSVTVSAFGENVPVIPKTEFILSWMQSSQPLIRSKL